LISSEKMREEGAEEKAGLRFKHSIPTDKIILSAACWEYKQPQ
jgi:hydroxylamine reductase (hybrid-cluster protein)